MRTICISYLIILLCICCTEKEDNSPFMITETHISHIGELAFNEEILSPTHIIKQDSVFIICDKGGDFFFHLYNAQSYNLINKLGTRGSGPDDFFNPVMMDINPQNNTLITFDDQSKLYREYKLTDLINNKFKNLCSYRLPQRVEKAISLVEYFITIGFFEHNMYGICKEDTIIKTEFEYPGDIELSDFKKSFIFNGKIKCKPDHTGFVYAGLYADIIEIFKINNNNSIRKIKSLYSYLPNYVDKSEGNTFKVSVKKETPNGFNDVVCTDKYIYAVYNGRTSIEYGYDYCWSNLVYVLDWNGNMIKKLHLDKDIWTICVDEKENKMYTISPNKNKEEDTWSFYIYDLKNII